MKVAIYARVSTENQEARGTIGSQLALLRERVKAHDHELVAEFCDDGYSGARLDRPGLDALRDAAEAGLIEAVWCLCPDRLARMYAYQVIVLDELARHGVRVLFTDAPALEDDPQARLLTQVQGVIAEYERAKLAERYRRGKLWRARLGEVIFWKAPYGYRRITRGASTMAHLVVYDAEAAVVRGIFEEYVAGGHSVRQIVRRLNADGIPSPSGKQVWSCSVVGRLLRNQTYTGRIYYNRTESVPDPRPGRKARQRLRPREQWIAIDVPRIISDEQFEAAQRVSRNNSQFSPRHSEPGAYLLRHLLKCGACAVSLRCHRMRARNQVYHRYYYCPNHDPIRAGGEQRRCPERNIRADALDDFVFTQVRAVLERPDVLLAGEHALGAQGPSPADELLTAQLGRLERRAEAALLERRRLVDLYQGGFIELTEFKRRTTEVDARHKDLQDQRRTLIDQRAALSQHNRLRQRIAGFARRASSAIDGLSFEQRQRLLRMVLEEVRVSGCQVDLRLRIPLDEDPQDGPSSERRRRDLRLLSTNDRLRSLGEHQGRELSAQGKTPRGPARQVRSR
jgi:site-specific DNA recombinase